jgi:hypothetical protein
MSHITGRIQMKVFESRVLKEICGGSNTELEKIAY